MRGWRRFIRDQAGATALVFALSTPVLFGGVVLTVDVTSLARVRTGLQNIADAAALAGAKELHIYRSDYSALKESVRQRTLSLMAERGFDQANASVDVTVDAEAGTITVEPTATADTILLKDLGYGEQIDATAVARAFGSVKLCVLALDEDGSAAIGASRLADIDAAECAVQSNSGQPDGISVDGLSSVTALAICSAGGVDGSSYNPPAETDCPPVEDPLASQQAPDPGPCTERNLRIILPRMIFPGHYCGGLKLGPTALVWAQPGEYVISGGPLQLGPASSLTGEGVSFRFVDEESTFSFGLGSIVQLSAPTTGPMAGYLFYQDPSVPERTEFLIGSDLVTKLLGTIYLPRGVLKIDVIGLVAAASAYTVVVADRLDVKGAHLVINSNYGMTDVPVPAGVGPTAGSVALER